MSARLLTSLATKLRRMIRLNRSARTLESNCQRLLFHQGKQLLASSSTASSYHDNVESDVELIERIIYAYRKANNADLGGSMWTTFFVSYHKSIHQALMNGKVETVVEIFRDPRVSDLFYGFDLLTKTYHGCFSKKSVRSAYAKLCLDGLVRFAVFSGAHPLDNPERWRSHDDKPWETEDVLVQISNKCWPFSVPNPFPEEHGLKTSRGILSYRVPQALYQAWRIKQLVSGLDRPRILEIGAGLGRTAYYAYELGLKDYSIVDIPITAASQAYFLGRTLGEANIHLDGESCSEMSEKTKILTPQTFMENRNSYDLIFNADSLTEMDLSTAKAYWQCISTSTNTFLSINQEANSFCVKDLISEGLPNIDITRSQSWMRQGYVEELVRMKT